MASGAPFTKSLVPGRDRNEPAAWIEGEPLDLGMTPAIALHVDTETPGEDVDRSIHRIADGQPHAFAQVRMTG